MLENVAKSRRNGRQGTKRPSYRWLVRRSPSPRGEPAPETILSGPPNYPESCPIGRVIAILSRPLPRFNAPPVLTRPRFLPAAIPPKSRWIIINFTVDQWLVLFDNPLVLSPLSLSLSRYEIIRTRDLSNTCACACMRSIALHARDSHTIRQFLFNLIFEDI